MTTSCCLARAAVWLVLVPVLVPVLVAAPAACRAEADLPNVNVQPTPGIHGPFAEWIEPTSVEVTWDTEVPTSSVLEIGPRPGPRRPVATTEWTTRHRLVVDDLEPGIIYQLRVGGSTHTGQQLQTDVYDLDPLHAYLPAPVPKRPSPYPQDELEIRYADLAQDMIDAVGTGRGYCLVLGSADGRLAYHLARRSDLQIVVVEPQEANVKRARAALDQAGLYGLRVSVHHGSLDDLPYGPYFANLIVSDTMLWDGVVPSRFASVYHCLRPAGGVLYLGTWARSGGSVPFRQAIEAWRGPAAAADHGEWVGGDARFWLFRRAKLAGSGEWTHQYGHADNSACSKDTRVRGDLAVQWWGRPGARPMPDRGNRNPPPVSAHGLLYVQGNRTLFGIDAYNGTIRWAKQLPTVRRANAPRDGSNMAASDTRLYVAIGPYCTGFDGPSGYRTVNLRVPQSTAEAACDWGYLACAAANLIGSGVKRGAHYLGDEGEWYETFAQAHIARVVSDYLFAVNPETGHELWHYRQGAIINSTITIGADHIYFVESRSEAARSANTGRLFDEVQRDQYLVALELAAGRVQWERPCDFSQCEYMTYMAYGDQTLLVTGTDQRLQFHSYAYDAGSGTEIWQHHTPNLKDHHTGWLDHPVIVGNRVHFNKHTYALRTGQVLKVDDFNWHGCGVMSASQHTIFRRYEYHGMLDLETGKRTELPGIRSGCWLSLIPSGGLLLAPETSAGCSCGHALQTSVAYVPAADVAPPRQGHTP